MSWYTLLLVHILCSLLPLSLSHCVTVVLVHWLLHLTLALSLATSSQIAGGFVELMAPAAVSLVSLYARLLLDRSQRVAYMETRRAVSMAISAHHENEKQEQLLLSILPRFVVGEMVRDLSQAEPNCPVTATAARGRGLSASGDLSSGDVTAGDPTSGDLAEGRAAQFHKIYVRRSDNVTIVFADIVGFTAMASSCTPDELVKLLNSMFARFDHIAEITHCLRIKLLGDCYYAVSGLPEGSGSQTHVPRSDHAHCGVELALGMLQTVQSLRLRLKVEFNMRIGVHSGSVLCGVIGLRKWQFDVWSDDVTIANHLESSGVPGCVHLSQATLDCLGDTYQAQVTTAAQRSQYLKERNITTYLITNIQHRSSISRLQCSAVEMGRCGDPSSADARTSHHLVDDPRFAEWSAEIPFENVNMNVSEWQDAKCNSTALSGAASKLSAAAVSGLPGDCRHLTDTKHPVPQLLLPGRTAATASVTDVRLDRNPPGGASGGKYPGGCVDNDIEDGHDDDHDDGIEEDDEEDEDGVVEGVADCELEQFITRSVETEAQLQYRRTSMKPWTLAFRDQHHEFQYQSAKVDMLKSSLAALTAVWTIQAAYCLLTAPSPFVCISTALVSFFVYSSFFLAMGDELTSKHCIFHQMSRSVTTCTFLRRLHFCIIITLMAIASILPLIPCNIQCTTEPDGRNQSGGSVTSIAGFYWGHHYRPLVTLTADTQRLVNALCTHASQPLDTSTSHTVASSCPTGRVENSVISWYNTSTDSQLVAAIAQWRRACHIDTCQLTGGAPCWRLTATVSCVSAEAFSVWWLAVVASVGVVLRLDCRIRVVLSLALAAGYIVATCWPLAAAFRSAEIEQDGRFNHWLTLRVILLVVIMTESILYQGRVYELITRSAYLWKLQMEEELNTLAESRENNAHLLSNILPQHVVDHFLSTNRNVDELYSRQYECVGVMFAGISNFSAFYSEDINRGLECIRLLNEIIVDFDTLLDDWRFACVEKIKTIGSTYMATSGLEPPVENQDNDSHLASLIRFAYEMERTLADVNKHSFNDFKLRIGASCGPLVGGVIGAKKPVFDIWSDTVNQASRMESTGEPGRIQVTMPLAKILRRQGFVVQSRGTIHVKGKGDMETFFVASPHQPLHEGLQQHQQDLLRHSLSAGGPLLLGGQPYGAADSAVCGGLQRQASARKNLATFMYGVMQNQRRKTLRSVSHRRRPAQSLIQRRNSSSVSNFTDKTRPSSGRFIRSYHSRSNRLSQTE